VVKRFTRDVPRPVRGIQALCSSLDPANASRDVGDEDLEINKVIKVRRFSEMQKSIE